MSSRIVSLMCFVLLMAGSAAICRPAVYFEEGFDSSALDPTIWRTEIVNSGPRWCDSYPGSIWGPGFWVDEGEACQGVSAQSPYGTVELTEGMVHLSSTVSRAFPFIVSRLPGPVALFPPTEDFTFSVRIRYDHVTPWGTFFRVIQSQSTEPDGDNPPELRENLLLSISPDILETSLSGQWVQLYVMHDPTDFHVISLDCAGMVYTIRIDDEVVYGPVASQLRPTAVLLGHPALAYWYPTDWQWFSVDWFKVEVPEPVPVAPCTWGAIKARYRQS
jgi:hypothetical protein